MDISEMMVRSDYEDEAATDIGEPTDLDSMLPGSEEIPDAVPVAEMSAVERIRAYRSGELATPLGTVVRDNPGDEDPAAEDDDDADDGAVDIPEGHSSAVADFPQGSGPGAFRLPVTRRRALVAAGILALVGVGIALPGTKKDDSSAPTVTAEQGAAPVHSEASAIPRINPDVVIAPVSAEGPEYPISLTPPMDAFSGEKGKGWVCAGFDGTVLTITLPEPMVLTEIGVVPGLEGTDKDGAELWAKHRIVTEVTYNLDYGDPIYGEYSATKRERQTTAIPGVITQKIRMVIRGTQDITGQAPASNTEPDKPGLLGDLGLDGGSPASTSTDRARPVTFAIGSIELTGHKPS